MQIRREILDVACNDRQDGDLLWLVNFLFDDEIHRFFVWGLTSGEVTDVLKGYLVEELDLSESQVDECLENVNSIPLTQ